MAAKAAAPKAKTTSVAQWDAELAAMAEMQAGTEAASGASNWISVRAGNMTYMGSDVPGNKLSAVVPVSVFENAYYEGAYDPEKPRPPVCFALSEDGEGMAPHENSPSPQHATCEGCPQNEFGSANVGRGKACKNIRRLALFSADEVTSTEGVESASPAFLKLPVTSVKAWSSYVMNLKNTLRRPTLAVVTEISCRSDPKTQVAVSFRLGEEIKDMPVIQAIKGRIDKLKEALLAPYSSWEEEEAPAPKTKTKRKF